MTLSVTSNQPTDLCDQPSVNAAIFGHIFSHVVGHVVFDEIDIVGHLGEDSGPISAAGVVSERDDALLQQNGFFVLFYFPNAGKWTAWAVQVVWACLGSKEYHLCIRESNSLWFLFHKKDCVNKRLCRN